MTKRIFAFIGAMLLIFLTIGTVIAAVIGAPPKILFAFIFCDIVFPVTIYAYMVITRQIRNMVNPENGFSENATSEKKEKEN